jgi:hypothetical protein
MYWDHGRHYKRGVYTCQGKLNAMLIDDILSRIQNHLGTTHDADVARALNVQQQNVSGWRRRGTIPWAELHAFAMGHGVPLDWLFKGDDSLCSIDEPTRQAMLAVKEIMESKDPCVVPALQANLIAFQMSVRANKENAEIKEKTRQVEITNAELKEEVGKLTKEVKYLKEINHPPIPDVASGGAGTST